jgi:hypothetical protein
MRDARLAALTGKAGEHMVASQLLIHGVVPSWPAVDTGCDLFTDSGCRLQVRCAHLYANKSYGPVYFFPLPKKRRMPNSDRTTKLVDRKSFAHVCDYVVFWGIEQNRFWIVPSALCDEVTGVELGLEPKYKRFTGSLKDMREMHSLGYSAYKIAKYYGIQQTSVRQFLATDRDTVDETTVSRMRLCENRWDYILEFGREVPDQTAIEIAEQVRETREEA